MNLKFNIKSIILCLVALVTLQLTITSAFAHVVVKPAEVGVGAYQTFTIGVPNEKDNPVVGLRLVIPEGLEHVSPNVKPGWNIQIKHAEYVSAAEETMDTEHDERPVTEIIWTGGLIPTGQRDDFLFSSKAPSEIGELFWKAYQTYADGTTVSWDLAPDTDSEESNSGPYSKTTVVNDLAGSEKNELLAVQAKDKSARNLPIILSGIAILISFFAIGLQFRGK